MDALQAPSPPPGPTAPGCPFAPIPPAGPDGGPAPLKGVRILSLALNLPGPAALMQLRAWGADCLQIDPPSGDPMRSYCARAYAELHAGIPTLTLNLKTEADRAVLHAQLARADVLLTSFRPSACRKLGLHWPALQRLNPRLSWVEIVGEPGERAEHPGHDLTYQAAHGLVRGTALPPSLLADMAGALVVSQAVLLALLQRQQTGVGSHQQVALSEAARWLALPRAWGLNDADSDVGGAHAGYQVYPCRDGRVAVAALEPHFAQRLCAALGLPPETDMRAASTHTQVREAMALRSRAELQALARAHDLPLHVLD